jgi:hypothetical protein
MKYFVQSIAVITAHSNDNIFFNRIYSNVLYFFVVWMTLAVALFLLTLPVVWKLQAKIGEIYGLLNKISSNDRQKYFKHFSNLNDEFKFKEEVDCSELNLLMANYDQKSKYFKSNNTRAGFSEDSMKVDQPKAESSESV